MRQTRLDVTLWAVIQITIELATFHFVVTRLVVFLFTLTCGVLELALFKTIPMLLQSFVEYHHGTSCRFGPAMPLLGTTPIPKSVFQ